jgi:hypothetical protein
VTFSGGGAVAPNGAGAATFAVSSEIANTPALGIMLLMPDNVSGASQAALFPLPLQ